MPGWRQNARRAARPHGRGSARNAADGQGAGVLVRCQVHLTCGWTSAPARATGAGVLGARAATSVLTTTSRSYALRQGAHLLEVVPDQPALAESISPSMNR
jgi:hypothetical protein